jgi:beta-phosphoglucomutase
MNTSHSEPPTNPDSPRAALWDLDGTLIDSSEYHWLTWRDALRAESYELTHAQFTKDFGKRNDVIIRGYFGEGLSADEVQRIADAKEQRYRELVASRGIGLLPGARDWLERLSAAGWRQALATSAPRLNVTAIMEALGLATFFDALVSAEEVERGKPDPHVFLAAAAKVGVEPARCVVVEDSPAGVEAGRRGGMHTVGVLTTNRELAADIVVASLADLPSDAFDRLVPLAAGEVRR